MSPVPEYTPVEIGQAKRDLVLDLLEFKKIIQSEGRVSTTMMMAAQMGAIRLTQAGVDWRNHKVRSRSYKGLLGVLYDEFKQYHHKDFIEV